MWVGEPLSEAVQRCGKRGIKLRPGLALKWNKVLESGDGQSGSTISDCRGMHLVKGGGENHHLPQTENSAKKFQLSLFPALLDFYLHKEPFNTHTKRFLELLHMSRRIMQCDIRWPTPFQTAG